MKTALSILACLALASTPRCIAQTTILREVNQLEHQGRFSQAATVLRGAITNAPPLGPDRRQLEFELARLRRIRLDFPLTRESLYAELKAHVRRLTRSEFETWVEQGRFDSREIDGKRYFMVASVSNLFFRYPELNSRRLPPKDTSGRQNAIWQTCRAIHQAAQEQQTPLVLPKTFRVTMNVTAAPGAAPDGETIRAWLPVPRHYPYQRDFRLLNTSSPLKHLDGKESPIRSVYLEQTAHAGEPTRFTICYEYTRWGVSFNLNPSFIHAADPNDPALKPFLAQGPHVVFTPAIRALSKELADKQSNPMLKAKAFYDWIGSHIKYSYAIEYSTIRNISDYCLTHRYGDCGQEALLFITLCRLNGIPARWQSGWNTFPGGKDIHDWTEIYLAPYGWVPVDPYMSVFAGQYATSLTPRQRHEVCDFYFGGMDQYRIAANSAHNQTLTPPKESMRSDNVDFQRGELEWDSHNIYFDKYSYGLTIQEVNPGPEPGPQSGAIQP